MVWLHNRSGEYSVRSGYWLASQSHNIDLQFEVAALPSLNPIKDKIWEVLAPSKIKMFLWKAVSGALPVVERLLTRGVRIDPRCSACGFEGESINHLLFLWPDKFGLSPTFFLRLMVLLIIPCYILFIMFF